MANKFLISTVLFLVPFTMVFSAHAEEICKPDEQLHNKCLYPTIKVGNNLFANERQVHGGSFGTAVVIRSEKLGEDYWNVAITAAHVVHSNEAAVLHAIYPKVKLEVRIHVEVAIYEDWSTFVKYETYPAHVYKVKKETDLAVLFFRTQRKLHTAEVAYDQNLYIGTEVMRIGCGLGDQPRVDHGRVTSLNPTFKAVKDSGKTRLSLHTVPGDSGGGVFYNYKLVGIMSSIRALGQLPIFEISYMSRINNIPKWGETDNCLSFLYNKEEPMPVISRYRMWFNEHGVNKRDFIHSHKYAIPQRIFP